MDRFPTYFRDVLSSSKGIKIFKKVEAEGGKPYILPDDPFVSIMGTIGFLETGLEFEEQFEESVDFVASLAMMFLERQFGVAVVTPDTSVELGKGDAHARKLLEMLAHVQPAIEGAHSDDWFSASGDLGGAARVYVASDSARWGGQVGNRGVRVLDPREVMNV